MNGAKKKKIRNRDVEKSRQNRHAHTQTQICC